MWGPIQLTPIGLEFMILATSKNIICNPEKVRMLLPIVCTKVFFMDLIKLSLKPF